MMHTSRTQVFAAVALFFLTSMFSFICNDLNIEDLNLIGENKFAGEGENVEISIDEWPEETSYDLSVDILDGDSFTHLEMDLTTGHTVNMDSIQWDSLSDWSHYDATYNGVNYNGTYMTTFGVENLWDFENLQGVLPAGWTSSNAANGLVNDNSNTGSGNLGYLSCGTNGTTGGSLVLRNGAVNVESNTMDLSGLSNGYVYFWMKEGASGCGEDPDTTEHLYFEYWASNNQWKTIAAGNCNPANTCPYFNAALGNPGYSAQDVTYTLPTDAFWSGFKFRFRQAGGSGTCCDWWFIDDVKVTVPGPGNWTSPSFGSHQSAVYSVEPGQYGIASIDAKTSGTFGLSWSVLDAITNKPIIGFENLNSRQVDLGTIDWQKHPLLRIFINSENGPFQIDSVNIQGKITDTFLSDPSAYWSGDYTWDSINQRISTTSTITSSIIKSHRPIAGWDLDFEFQSAGIVEVSVDKGPFYEVAYDDTTMDLPNPAHTIQFKISNAVLSTFDVELYYASLPENLKLNIADDERIDWSLDINQMGPWGWQNRFADGNMTQSLDLISSTTASTSFWLPSDTVMNSFSFELWSEDPNQDVGGVQWELFCGNILIDQMNFGPISSERVTYRFAEGQLEELNSALINGQKTSLSIEGVDFVECLIEFSGSGSNLMVDGLLARFDESINLQFTSSSLFINELNAYTSSVQTSSSNYLNIPIPVTTTYSSELNFEIINIDSVSGMTSTLIDFVNSSTTLTPSESWLEMVTTHTSETEVLENIQVEIAGLNNRVVMEWPILGGTPTVITNGENSNELVELHPTNSGDIVLVSSTPQEVDATFKFRLNPSWDDEPFVTISSRVTTPEGFKSLPAVQKFGLGDSNGIENDYYISEWNVINDIGAIIPSDLSYLKASTVVTFSAKLAFEGLNDGSSPRSDLLVLKLFQDDLIVGQTQEVDGNLMNISLILPPTEQELTYTLVLEELVSGGDDLTSINLTRDFLTDSRAPMVMGSSVEEYDHREPNNEQTLSFEIADRPILPPTLTLMLWRQWMDDFDYDDYPDPEEYQPQQLIAPENLSVLQDNFTYIFSDLLGDEGDIVTGYLVGADAAGNVLQLGGSSDQDQQLFTYQLKEDGPPELVGDDAKWDIESTDAFRHPMIDYTLIFPLVEPNGLSDIELISLTLDQDSFDEDDLESSLEIRWDGETRQCSTESAYLILGTCDVFAETGSVGPYTSDLEFRVTFSFKWNLDDTGQIRTPEIMVVDRGGNEDINSYPNLAWKFNAEIWIPYDTIQLEFTSGNQDYCPISQTTQNPTLKCAWVYPSSEITISGQVQFYWTNALPTEELDIEIIISGLQPTLATVENGFFSVTITAPQANGGYALSWELFALPLSNIDQTSQSSVSLVVDSEEPTILEVVKPRTDVEISEEDMYSIEFEASFKETYLNTSNVILHWRVIYDENPSVTIVEGMEGLDVVSNAGTGTLSTTIQVGGQLLDSHYTKPSTLQLWITGTDMAGNPFNLDENSVSTPLAEIPIHHRRAIVSLAPSDIQYSPPGEQNSGEVIQITIMAKNIGDAQGDIFFTIYEVLPSGATKTIASKNETIPLGSQPIQLRYEWVPNMEGLHHVRVEWGEQTIEGPFIEILPPKATGLNAVFEDTNPVLVVSFVGLIVAVVILLVVVLRKGKDDEYEWVEWEEESYDSPSKVPPVSENNPIQTPAPMPVATPPPQKQPEARYQTDAYGAAYEAATEGKGDGWWQDEHGQWWQKSEDGSWWHQSTDGEWHKLEGY